MVVDAGVVVRASLDRTGRETLASHELIAPPLVWSELSSVLHSMKWRGAISDELADGALERARGLGVVISSPADLLEQAWKVADRLGWARTYDAEYVAVALNEGVPLLTVDARLGRGAARLVGVITPADL